MQHVDQIVQQLYIRNCFSIDTIKYRTSPEYNSVERWGLVPTLFLMQFGDMKQNKNDPSKSHVVPVFSDQILVRECIHRRRDQTGVPHVPHVPSLICPSFVCPRPQPPARIQGGNTHTQPKANTSL